MARERILICDEDPDDRQTIAWLLKEHGYHVTALEKESRLLETLESRAPDLCLNAARNTCCITSASG